LRRLWVEPFLQPVMHTLAELERIAADGGGTAALDQLLLPLESGLSALPALRLTAEQAMQLQQGKRLQQGELSSQALCCALDGAGKLVALVEIDPAGEVRVRRGFGGGS